MGPTRYRWWGYVKFVIRAYPDLSRALDDLHRQSITPAYESTPHGTAVNRTAENIALRTLPAPDMREYEAVRDALEFTSSAYKDGALRVELIRLVFFSKTHTLQGACDKLNVSYGTGKKWHNAFIKTVAKNMNLI